MASYTLSTEKIGRSPPHPRADMPRGGEDHAAPPVMYEWLTDDGPFRRMSDAEARRLVIFACFYYCGLGVALLAAFIWR